MIGLFPARPSDIQQIRDVAFETWPVAYGEILSKPQLGYMLDKLYSVEKLEADMQSGHQFWILQDSGKTIGFCAFEHGYKPATTHLHKIYLLPKTQGKGFGKILLQLAVEKAMAAGDRFLSLNVNRFNSARHFYEKEGFHIDHEVDIDIGEGYLMEDFVMIRPL